VIHPKTLLISRHFYSLESYVWRSIYNLKIDTISMYDIPLDRSFLKLWNGIRHVMPSTDRRLELKEKTSMAQNAWQAFVYANGLIIWIVSTVRCPSLKQNLMQIRWSTHSVIVNAIFTKYISSLNSISLANYYPHRRVTVNTCAVRSPLTGCQVTSRPCDWFLRYSKWTDTFQTDLI